MNILKKVTDWYFSQRALPYWCILVIDCAIVLFSGYFSCYLVLGGDGLARNFWLLTYGLLMGLVPFIAAFRALHTYSGIVRYSSFVDLQRVMTASLIGSASLYMIGLVTGLIWPDQTAILFPDIIASLAIFFISTLLLWLVRIVVKRLFDSFHLDNAVPVVIYGTKAGGISLAKSIMTVKNKKYSPHAFISDGK